MIPTRLKALREKRGLSKSELARRVGVSHTAISQFESGQRGPSSEVLASLADTLNVTVDYLLGRDEEPTSPRILFRNLERFSRTTRQRILEQVERAEKSDPVLCARKLLKELGISKAPVDPYKVARSIGVKLEERNLPRGDGFLVKLPGEERIMVNKASIETRKRFTVAHELGHLRIPSHTELTYTDVDIWGEKVGLAELEADEFAVELLMPEELFVQDVRSSKFCLETINNLADKYRVSRTACAKRYVSLCSEKCALILSEDGLIKWFDRSESFKHFIPVKEPVSEESLAYEFFSKGLSDSDPKLVPARAWISDLRVNSEMKIFEQCFRPIENQVLSLVWFSHL